MNVVVPTCMRVCVFARARTRTGICETVTVHAYGICSDFQHKICILFAPQQLTASLPAESPELQFGLSIYRNGTVKMHQQFVVRHITVDIAGVVAGMEDLVVGKQAHVIIRWVGH